MVHIPPHTATSALQHLFGIAYTGLAKQGFRRATDPFTGKCRYRGDQGTKCAVGHLIPDEAYKPETEKLGVWYLAPCIEQWQGVRCNMYVTQALQKLQGIHDACDTPSVMGQELRAFAKQYDLSLPPLEQPV